jgi:hypothetical protein
LAKKGDGAARNCINNPLKKRENMSLSDQVNTVEANFGEMKAQLEENGNQFYFRNAIRKLITSAEMLLELAEREEG